MKMRGIHTLNVGLAVAACLMAGAASAVPVAQLDIVGTDVTYDSSTQTVITTDPVFTLYGYGNTPAGNGKTLDTSLDWYLSIAITPQVPAALATTTDFGSFSVDGITYDASDFVYGTPPLDQYALQSTTLQPHSVYDTLYMLIGVTWDPNQTRSSVDVQSTQGTNPLTNPGSAMMYVGWNIDIGGMLGTGFNLHFDLFGQDCSTGVCNIKQFAPFSHDAETSVPEPQTLSLLGAGLLLLGALSRRRRRSRRSVAAA